MKRVVRLLRAGRAHSRRAIRLHDRALMTLRLDCVDIPHLRKDVVCTFH